MRPGAGAHRNSRRNEHGTLARPGRPAGARRRPSGPRRRRGGASLRRPSSGRGGRRGPHGDPGGAIDPTVFRLAIFVLAIFVGYYVVWSVTPALHTPLMSVTN